MYINPMTLAEFMQAAELDDEALAAKIGRSRVSVSRYRRGLETPSTPVIVQIVELSDGRVTANELLGIHNETTA